MARTTMGAALAGTLLAWALSAATAQAGTYDVVACNAPGAGGINNSWNGAPRPFTNFTTGETLPPDPESYDIYDDCRGATGSFFIQTRKGLQGDGQGGNRRAAFLRSASWDFNAPAGTVISRLTVWRFAGRLRVNSGDPNPSTPEDEGDPWDTNGREANGNVIGGFFGEQCDAAPGSIGCSFGSDTGVSPQSKRTYDLNTTRLTYAIGCPTFTGCDRSYDTASIATLKLFGARVTLRDDSSPSLKLSGPLVVGGWRRPTDPLVYDAGDNSGIRAARVEYGGGVSDSTRRCDFTWPVPCTNLSGARFTGRPVADGIHMLKVGVQDAAGNPTVLTRTVKIDGTAPSARLEPARGRSIAVAVTDEASGVAGGEIQVRSGSSEAYRPLATTFRAGTLKARLDRGRLARTDVRVSVRDNAGNAVTGVPARFTLTSARTGRRPRAVRRDRVVVPYGRFLVVRGRLTLSAGQPLGGVAIGSTAARRELGAVSEPGPTTRTNGRGRFALRLPAGPSRTVRLLFNGAGQALRAVRGLSVRVPASSTIAASRKRLAGAGRVRFTGRLRTAGQPVPRRGVVVILQGRERGHWRTFKDTRTDRRGHWRASYRFSGRAGTYPVRARIRKQNDFPFELGYSRILRVAVR